MTPEDYGVWRKAELVTRLLTFLGADPGGNQINDSAPKAAGLPGEPPGEPWATLNHLPSKVG